MALEDYSIKYSSRNVRPGAWNVLDVEIFCKGEKIGEYTRSYHDMMNTFVPFMQRGKEYALISYQYVGTAVMRLPSCEIIAEEEYTSWGFCPVDYYVPYYEEEGKPACGLQGDFGFVAGCVWGDDSSWKIQFLDLRRIEDGIILRDERFGYIELPGGIELKDAINTEHYCVLKDPKHPDDDWDRTIKIAIEASYHLSENYQPTSSWLYYKPFGDRGMKGIHRK